MAWKHKRRGQRKSERNQTRRENFRNPSRPEVEITVSRKALERIASLVGEPAKTPEQARVSPETLSLWRTDQ